MAIRLPEPCESPEANVPSTGGTWDIPSVGPTGNDPDDNDPLMGSPRRHYITKSETIKYEFVWPDQQRYDYMKRDDSGSPVMGSDGVTPVQDINQDVNHDLLTLTFYQDASPGVLMTRATTNGWDGCLDLDGGCNAESKNAYVWIHNVCVQRCPNDDCTQINGGTSA